MRAPRLLLRFTSKVLAFAALLVVFTAGSALAQDICYVDTGGDDAQNGQTAATANRTIAACLGETYVGDGDIISIEAGEYDEAHVTVSEDLIFEARQTGSFTRVLVDNGMTVDADVTFRANTNGSFNDGVFRLGADNLTQALILSDGSLTVSDAATGGRLRIPDDGRVTRDDETSVDGAITYLGTANVFYTDNDGDDNDVTAGSELPSDFDEGDLNVNIGDDNTLTFSQITGLTDLDVAANSVLSGTVLIEDDITITGPGNAGTLDVDDGVVTLDANLAVASVNIADNDDITFAVGGNTVTINGDFIRLGGDFTSAAGAQFDFVGDDTDNSFSPGPNFAISTVTIDKDGQTLSITEDLDVTDVGGAAFTLADGSTVSFTDDQINVTSTGIVDIDGTVTNLSTIVFRTAGATMRGDGFYGDILVATGGGDVNVDGAAGAEEDVRFTGTLNLSSGGINVADATDDISPNGSSAKVLVNAASAATDIGGAGSFNDDDVDYDLEYTGDIGGGTKTAGSEFAADDIKDLTFNTQDGTVDAVTNGTAGTISGNVALNDVGDAYEVDIPTPITIEGTLTIGDDATLDGTVLTLQGASASVVGTISNTTTTTLDADLTLSGSSDDDNPASVGAVVVNDGHTVTISNIQVIDGDLTTNTDAELTITLADEQDITGDLTIDGDAFTLGSDVDVAGAVDIDSGTLAFAGNDLSVAGNFVGAADVSYTSSGGALIHTADGAVLTLAGETLPRLELAENVNIDLGSDAVISVEFVESGTADLDVVANDLTLGGTVTSDGGTFLDATGAGSLTFNTASVRIGGTAVIDIATTVDEDAVLSIITTSGSTEDLAISDDLTIDGTVNVNSNDLFIQGGGDLISDGGSVNAATSGRVILSTAGDVNLDGTGITIPNLVVLGANDLIGDDDAELTVTSTLRFDDDLNLDQDNAPDLVLGDGVTITLNFADPLDEEPTFGDNISLVYNIAGGVTTGNELPDDGIVWNLTVQNDELEIDEDVTVNGTLTLAGPIDNETQGDDLVLAAGATLRLEGDNNNVLADADITATSYNLTYANDDADELISDAEFIDGATVTTLTVDVDDQDVILDEDRSLGSLVLESGEFDLDDFDITVTGDLTFNDGDLKNDGAATSVLIFGGADAQTFTLAGDFAVPADINVRLDKSANEVVTLAGPAGATLDFRVNAQTIVLNGGILETEDDTDVFLYQDDDEQGFTRTLAAGEESHIAGNITKRLAQGDPFGAGRSARFEFPSGSPDTADPQYRPFALTFRNNIATQTDITVNHQDVSPGGSLGLPVEGDQGVTIGNYPDFYWLVESSISLGQAQQFDVELTATDIGFPITNDDSLRIIKRFDGNAASNEWDIQGTAANYDNFLSVVGSDTTVIARVVNSTGGIVPQGARFTLGIPTRAPAFADGDGTTNGFPSDTLVVAEGDTLEFDFDADPRDLGETVSYSLEDAPANSTIDDDTGEFTFMPDFTQSGTYDVTVIADDGTAQTSAAFVISVTNVNRAPVFTAALPDTTVDEGVLLTYDYDATDEDGEDVEFSLVDGPDGAEIDSATGEFTWTPSFAQANMTFDIVVDASDGTVATRDSAAVTVGTERMLGDVNGDGQLTPADASLTLAAVVGDQTLTDGQEFAAEVSGDDLVGAFDAGLMLQCITENGGLPVDDTSTCDFPAESNGKAGFVASGDMGWGEARTVDGGSIAIPLRVSGNVANVYAVEFEGEMDMSAINLRSVQGQLPDGWQIAWKADKETGRIRLAAVGGTPISDAGTVAELIFELQDPNADVSLQGEASVNDNAAAQLGSMAVKEVPTEFALGNNYPNPFNPTTTFEYGVPEASRVTIEVWDVSGRLVQTLVDSEMEAGRYEVRWDGRSNAGSPVASGLYMYRMQAGSFTKVKTMMLVK